MTEYFRGAGGEGRWIVEDDEAYFLDVPGGQWGPSRYRPRTLRSMVFERILDEVEPFPFTLVLTA